MDFLISAPADRTLAQRLAADFCPLPEHILANSGIRSIFRRITLLWAFVNIVNAGVAVWLLVSQPLPTYLAARTALSLACTGSAIALSTLWFKRSMRHHGLSAEPFVPSMCQRGKGRVVVVLISTMATAPLSKSMQTRAMSSQSLVQTFPRSCAKTCVGRAGRISRQI